MATREKHLRQVAGNADLNLTSEERQVIANFRAMERCAQQMIIDLAAQYCCTLPAKPVSLTLVTG